MTNVFIVKNKSDAKFKSTTKVNLKNATESYELKEEKIYSCKESDAKKLFEYGEKSGRKGFILFVTYCEQGKIDTKDELSNAVTTVQKDSLVVVEKRR